MGDAASQMAAQEAMAGAVQGRGPFNPGALQLGAAPGQGAWPQAVMADTSGQLQEPALLAQLVQLLGQRPRHSLLLSDLGALLPGPLRHGVKERGGLRSWLQKYPELFQVSGYPGKESVTLLLGTTSAERAAAGSTGGGAAKQAGKAGSAEARDSEAGRRDEEDEENESAVQMRGLPYRATVGDVKKFLGAHLGSLKDDTSIQLVANRDGRPSGFARVQFDSPASARAARDGLHMQVMEVSNNSPGSTGGTGSGAQDRYVEVFLYADRPNKLRIKKLTAGGGNAITEEEAMEASKVSKDQVVAECREHMMSPGKGQLLLSMLGVALSDSARLYLKKTDQGLKQFLSQYPHEFTVDGVKGRECVSYLPALAKGSHNNSDLPVGFPQSQGKARRSEQGTGGPASGSISDLQRFPRREEPAFMPQSPKVTEKMTVDTPKELATPSDWGTPQPSQYLPGYDPRALAPRNGPDAGATAGVQRGEVGFNAAVGMAATGVAGMDDWTAWAMPPPNFWPDPACWSQDGSAALAPWSAVDTQTLGVLQPMQAAGMLTALAPLAAGPGQPALPNPPSQDPAAPAAVHLRGLPFNATEQDVLAFFAKHDVVDRVSEAPNAVNIIKKPNGKSTGQAVVQMMSRTDAHVTLRVLNGQYMDSRYIEVAHHTEGSSTAAAQPSYASAPGATHPAAQGMAVAGAMVAGGAMASGAVLQPVGMVQAAPCQAAVAPARPVEAQSSAFDGASDTGGSGGAAGAGVTVGAFPQPMWWAAAPAPLEGATKAPSAEATPRQGGGGAAPAAGKAPGAPPGNGAAPMADEEQERWEVLFNFLKRDTEAPPASPGLATADTSSTATPSPAVATATPE